MTSSRVRIAALAFALLPALPATAEEPPEREIVLEQVQMKGGYLAGSANLDGAPGDELLLGGLNGGFYVARGDGGVLWRHSVPGSARPRLIPDATGDGRPDVAAATGFPGAAGEVLVLAGSTGQVLARRAMHSPVGRIGAGDLDADGDVDLVVPSVDGTIRLVALLGPDFEVGWTATLPGQLNAYWVFSESLDVGNVDADPADEIVFGTRLAGNNGGKLYLLEGRTGQTRWSVDTGAVFGVKVAGGRIAALLWHLAGLTFRAELVGFAGTGGAPTWTVPLAGYIKASNMTVADVDADGQPEVVAGTTNFQEGTALFGLDPSTTIVYAVGVGDGRPRWTHKVNRELSVITPVARAGGGSDIAYGTDAWISSSSDEQVGLISGATGAPAWLHVRGAETHDDAIQGVQAADLDADGTTEIVYSATEHKIVGLNLADGSVRYRKAYPGIWTAAAGGDLDGDGALDLVGGGASGLVEALRPDGSTRWRSNVGGIIGGVRLSGGSVLVVSLGIDARVVALDPLTGAQRWSFSTGVQANNPFSVHQQTFGDMDGDGVDEAIVGGSQNLRPVVAAVNGRTGTLLWRSLSPIIPPGSQPVTWLGSVQSLRAVGGDVAVYLRPLDSREPATPRLALLNGVGGAPRWSTTATRGDIDATIFPLGDQIVFAFLDQHLTARRRSDGTEAWAADLGRQHVFTPAGDRVAALSFETGLARTFAAKLLGPSGVATEIEDANLSGARAAATVPGAGIAYACDEGLLLLDEAALRNGELAFLDALHLKPYTSSNGQTFEVPSIRQMTTADVAGRSYAIATQTTAHLNGGGGEAPGMWAARLKGPA